MNLDYIIGWLFIGFGTIMGSLCTYHGVRKILKGEITFRGIWLIKKMDKFEGSLKDFSGTEILAIGLMLLGSTALLYFMLFV